MPGNEQKIAKYLIQNKGKISLRHLGIISSIGVPGLLKDQYEEMKSLEDVDRCLATEDSGKKADIYVNGHGMSLKQMGATFPYNRLQRANLLEIFNLLGFKNPDSILERLDKEVEKFHRGKLDRRNRAWSDFFTEIEFKALTKFLMMEGSPNLGVSLHPAEFILEAPARNITAESIGVYIFDEYFNKYISKLKVAIRRQWVGQASESEHKRARGLARKTGNAPWVFNDVAGMPNIHRSGRRWRQEVPPDRRKTVYFLMLEKER